LVDADKERHLKAPITAPAFSARASRPLSVPRLGPFWVAPLPPPPALRALPVREAEILEPPEQEAEDPSLSVDDHGEAELTSDTSSAATTPPVYQGNSSIIDYSVRAKSGMQAKLGLLVDEHIRHPFKGLKTGGQGSGQRLRLVISDRSEDDAERPLYVGEALLAWWAEDCKSGMSVTLRFDDGPDGSRRHPLEGKAPGETVFLACWSVSDQEEFEAPEVSKKKTRAFKNMGPAQQSQIKCRLDTDFQSWTLSFALRYLSPEEHKELPSWETSHSDFAAAVVRLWCGIESRSEFARATETGERARARWQEMLSMFDARSS